MIFDLHNDLPTSGFSDSEKLTAAQSVSETVVYAFWTTELKDCKKFIINGIIRLKGENRMFAIEDMHFVTKQTIHSICKLPIIYCSLTHNKSNALAGGALDSGKLTELGKYVIIKLNSANITVDVSHLNRESFWQVADISENIIASHIGLDSLVNHPRNLTDAQVQAILERGGIIGLTAVRDFLGGNTVQNYLKLIDSFVQKFGVDGACIGTDFYGTAPLENLEGYSDFSSVAYKLSQYGYTDTDINKIFYENANNYFKNRRKNLNATRYL